MPRLTSKKNGQWTYVTRRGKRKPIGARPLPNMFRVIDRVIFGPDNGRNTW